MTACSILVAAFGSATSFVVIGAALAAYRDTRATNKIMLEYERKRADPPSA